MAATHVVVAKLVVAKLGLTTHRGNLVLKVAVSILVEDGNTQLWVAACVFLFAFCWGCLV